MAFTRKQVADWFITVGDAVLDFASAWVPGIDRIADSIKRGYKGDPIKLEEAIAKGDELLTQLYQKVYGYAPKSPSDLNLIKSQSQMERAMDIKSQARGSLAAQHVVEKKMQAASHNLKSSQEEYSKALQKYNDDNTMFQGKLAKAQVLANKIERAASGEAGWSTKDSLKGYEKHVQEI